MKKVIDSAMETMHVLGCGVEEIKDAVETLMKIIEMPVITALPEEPYPIRAFPDHFYYRPVGVKGTSVISGSLGAPQWIPYRAPASDALDVRYRGTFCACGHKWEEHMPCCVHLVEGCSCEEFMRVPMGHAEGG